MACKLEGRNGVTDQVLKAAALPIRTVDQDQINGCYRSDTAAHCVKRLADVMRTTSTPEGQALTVDSRGT